MPRALPRTVAVHEPCSQRNSLKNQQATYDLLAKIPGLSVVSLPDNKICCGAGGVNMVAYPEIAEPLREAKLQGFADSRADVLVTSNIGCALHLQAGLSPKSVVHPINLLAAAISQ
jgi:glycolate oxidase iron-sulfur subunit